jgi:hypothetical protein
MEDDVESVELTAKVREMHIIQIFGFDGKTFRFPVDLPHHPNPFQAKSH